MRKDLISFKPVYSSLLTCDKDIQKILKTLFISSKPYSDLLKRLLIINNRDCLDTSRTDYQKVIDSYSLGDLMDKGYIRLNSKVARGTHEEIKTYILFSLDNFRPNSISAHYIDYNINFDIICYNDAWVLNDYRIRPVMICGYIDGILNSLTQENQKIQKTHQSQIKLSGIGQYQFLGCDYNVLNEDFSMYTITYHGTHFVEDMQKLGYVPNE